MEREIREFALSLGVDDIGFAKAGDYHSPKSFEITKFLPDAKSIIVLVFKVLSSCESPSMPAADNGLFDLFAFVRIASYRISRFLESRYGARIATMPDCFPFELSSDRKYLADFSQRHAAIAAGLGSWGRHNLVIHPRFGTRVNFASIITNLDLSPSPKRSEDLCTKCNICVDNCPAGALDEEGKTDVDKCARYCQPYGRHADVDFWRRFVDSSPEERKEMFKTDQYMRLRVTTHLGITHECFNCMSLCPIGDSEK